MAALHGVTNPCWQFQARGRGSIRCHSRTSWRAWDYRAAAKLLCSIDIMGLQRCVFTLVLLAFISSEAADIMNSRGRDFMLTFMYNHHFGPNAKKANFLFVTSDYRTEVIVEMADTGSDPAAFINVTVTPGVAKVIEVPDRAELEGRTGTMRKGVSVRSDQDIAVYALNEDSLESSEDAFAVLPVTALSTHYSVPSVWSNPSLAVVGVQDSTTVNVNLRTTCDISYNGRTYSNNDKFSVTLNTYDVFQLYTAFSNDSSCDLGGTLVTSDLAVAVFSGGSCAKLSSGCDHVAEMVPPTEHWGRRFIVPDLHDNSGYRIRVLSFKDNNRVYMTEHHKDGTQHSQANMLESGEVVDWDIPDGTTMEISSYYPVHISQYDVGYAPFVIPIPSIDHYGWNYTVPTLENSYGRSYISYMNIVVKTFDKDTLLMDAGLVNANWLDLYDIGYSVTSVAIPKGTHVLVADSPFMVQVYGYYTQGSYGYQGGYGLSTLPSKDIVLDTPTRQGNAGGNGHHACADEPGFDCKLFDATLGICTSPSVALAHCKKYCDLCDGPGGPVVG